MNSSIDLDKSFELRKESREKKNFPRAGALIKPVGEEVSNGAIALDISSSGIALVSSHTYPVGTIIEIELENNYSAIGEIVGLREDWDEWDWHGMACMNVRLTEKREWPL